MTLFTPLCFKFLQISSYWVPTSQKEYLLYSNGYYTEWTMDQIMIDNMLPLSTLVEVQVKGN